MLETATFFDVGRCRLQMTRRGSTRIATSVMMLGIEFPIKKWLSLTPHWKVAFTSGATVGLNCSQKAAGGMHWKIVIKICAHRH